MPGPDRRLEASELMRGACCLLPHQGNEPPQMTAIALHHGSEFRALGDRHTDALDDDVVDLVGAIVLDEAPVDSKGCCITRTDHVGRYNDPVAIAPAAADLEIFAAKIRQPGCVD